ncbi:MAG: DUF2808 domain-containing protein [Cyanobacteriota bacterium]
MKRTAIYTAALSLLATTSILTFPVSAGIEGKHIHVDGTEQFPKGKVSNFRQNFELHIPQGSNPISQLSLKVPPGLTVRNNISISDQSGRKINANVSLNGRKIIIAFPEPVAPGTQLDIAMNQVRRWGVSNAWRYPVAAKFIGSNAERSIGVAVFKAY